MTFITLSSEDFIKNYKNSYFFIIICEDVNCKCEYKEKRDNGLIHFTDLSRLHLLYGDVCHMDSIIEIEIMDNTFICIKDIDYTTKKCRFKRKIKAIDMDCWKDRDYCIKLLSLNGDFITFVSVEMTGQEFINLYPKFDFYTLLEENVKKDKYIIIDLKDIPYLLDPANNYKYIAKVFINKDSLINTITNKWFEGKRVKIGNIKSIRDIDCWKNIEFCNRAIEINNKNYRFLDLSISGKRFKELYPNKKFYKLFFSKSNIDEGLEYNEGLNEIKNFIPNPYYHFMNGIYFNDIDNLPLNIIHYDSVREVEIYDDSLVCIIDSGKNYMTNKINLGVRILIKDLDCWKNYNYCNYACHINKNNERFVNYNYLTIS